jgi:O-methyltransferase involved in polyketide biosynthesis
MAALDTSKPNIARMYDYWLGGKDNFEVDREAAEAVRASRPDVADLALENKKFLTRAVGYVAGQGVRQFIDVGSGLPTSPLRAPGASPFWLATHEAARAVEADAMVAYVDSDPVAVRHSQALLSDGGKRVVAAQGDLSDPGAVLAHDEIVGAGLDLSEPACVVLGCVLHFVPTDLARRSVAAFAGAMAPGSYLIISVGFDGSPAPDGDFADTYNAQAGPAIYRQSRDGISALFTGLEVMAPGVVDAAAWRPEQPHAARPAGGATILAGVGRTR